MTPERFQQIDRLLELALEQTSSERADFLEKACAGDEELRREVEALLQAHGQTGSFIEAPALDVAVRATLTGQARLVAGQQIGSYKILALLGTGGMGEVYRAKDTRIGREVAIKVLPSAFSADSDRLRRFEQEARATGRLNHPNILAIYDVGTHEGSPYIVSELLEGKTLRDRLGGKALPVRKAIDYALQIAHGLAAAHEKDIVHRDLKPENLFVTRDGRVKILDFGLAKLQSKPGSVADTQSPTQILSTEPGLVLGTVGYMSPEQVRGEPADHRSDIFAFGAIVYEMISGQRVFQGKSAAEMMSAILNEEPPELSKTNGQIPQTLEHMVRHCLEKTPEQRFQSARDLCFDLEELSGAGDSTSRLKDQLPERSKRRERFAWILSGVCLLALLGVLLFASTYFRRSNNGVQQVSFSVYPPAKWTFEESLALSPDGRWLAFVATRADGKNQLWLRPLDSLTAQVLPGTEGALYPFWSPDSQFIGFFADGKLKKIQISGGPAQTLSDAPSPLGGTWNRDGDIVFGPSLEDPLYRVAASGGNATPVTTVDRSRSEAHLWPSFLPDGRHFLYLAWSSPAPGIRIGSLDQRAGEAALIPGADSNAFYAGRYVFFWRAGSVFALPFDAKQLKATGEPFPVTGEHTVANVSAMGNARFFVTENALAYRAAESTNSQLVWFNRDGKPLSSVSYPEECTELSLSPDGRQVVVSSRSSPGANQDIWLFEPFGSHSSRFTFGAEEDASPFWSPDGNRIVFTSIRTGYHEFYEKASSGAGDEKLLLQTRTFKFLTDWSLDGRYIVYGEFLPKTSMDLCVLPLFGDRKPFPFLQTQFDEWQGKISPNGRWIAYTSNESGKGQVYVQAFPASGGKWQISDSGRGSYAFCPSWRRDGKELFYVADRRKMMVMRVDTDSSTFSASAPELLFEGRFAVTDPNVLARTVYAVTADGQRFLINTALGEPTSAPITVVLNWAAGLKR